MHELAITQSLLEITLQHAQAANAKKVNQLNLVIGQLSSVVDESVQFYWCMIAKDTIAEEAKLHFERRPATLHCFNCNTAFEFDGSCDFACPSCNSMQVQITSGDDFRLDSIDVD